VRRALLGAASGALLSAGCCSINSEAATCPRSALRRSLAVTAEMPVAEAEQGCSDRSRASQRDWPGAAASRLEEQCGGGGGDDCSVTGGAVRRRRRGAAAARPRGAA
jgi:hypothetical protein